MNSLRMELHREINSNFRNRINILIKHQLGDNLVDLIEHNRSGYLYYSLYEKLPQYLHNSFVGLHFRF